jgi:hypothetical protein
MPKSIIVRLAQFLLVQEGNVGDLRKQRVRERPIRWHAYSGYDHIGRKDAGAMSIAIFAAMVFNTKWPLPTSDKL